MLRSGEIYPKHVKNINRKFRVIRKNSDHFIQLLKPTDLHDQDILVRFDVVSLFTNVPTVEALQIIKTKLHTD